MSVLFDAAADRLLATTGVQDYNAAYTWMGWFYAVSLSGAPVIHVISDGFYSNFCDEVYVSVASSNALTSYIANSTFAFQFGTILTTATWYHIAAVRESATSFKVYLNGVLDTTNTFDVTGRTASVRQESGAWSAGNNDPFSGRVAHMKMWNAALTAGEVASEVRSIWPRRRANLWRWTALRPGARLADWSGNGRDWTAGGTLTDADDPPSMTLGGPLLFMPYADVPAAASAGPLLEGRLVEHGILQGRLVR